MKIQFSLKITLICLVLMLGMIRASFWQWERHLEKKDYIEVLKTRMAEPIEAIKNYLTPDTDWKKLNYRQLKIEGTYDYSNEIVISNRRHDDQPGKHVITPLQIKGTEKHILINRGFVPLDYSKKEQRIAFQKSGEHKIIGLIKPSNQKTFFLQPSDPEPDPVNKSQNWLRVDIERISKQTGYSLLPIYAELVPDREIEPEKDLIQTASDKTEILVLPGNDQKVAIGGLDANVTYPIPDPNKVIPPGRHLGYVYEWAFMALLTFLIGLVLQLKRN